jgi:hypothetical protein
VKEHCVSWKRSVPFWRACALWRWASWPAAAALGFLSAGLYFTLALPVARASPQLLDARLVGLHFLALLVVGAAFGALGAVFGYRKSLGVRLF